MKNPPIIVIPLARRHDFQRTTFAQFCIDHGELYSVEEIGAMATELKASGVVLTRNGLELIIDATPTEADVIAWAKSKAQQIIDATGVSKAAVTVTGNAGMHGHHSFSVHGEDICEMGFSDLKDPTNRLAKKLGNKESRAEAKREAARKLIAEADAISPEVYHSAAA